MWQSLAICFVQFLRWAHAELTVNELWTHAKWTVRESRKEFSERYVNSERKMNDLFGKSLVFSNTAYSYLAKIK